MKIFRVVATKRNGHFFDSCYVEEAAMEQYKELIQSGFEKPLVFIVYPTGMEKDENSTGEIFAYTEQGFQFGYKVKG